MPSEFCRFLRTYFGNFGVVIGVKSTKNAQNYGFVQIFFKKIWSDEISFRIFAKI